MGAAARAGAGSLSESHPSVSAPSPSSTAASSARARLAKSASSARRNFRFKSCRSILEKVPLKSGVNQVDLAKAADVAVDLHDTVHLYLSTVQREPIRNTNVRYMYIVLL